jgi:hypothetical protein
MKGCRREVVVLLCREQQIILKMSLFSNYHCNETIGVDGARAFGAMLQRNGTLLELSFACTQPTFVGIRAGGKGGGGGAPGN